MTLLAGVDSSTQSCKLVVCDLESGRVIREGRAVHPPGTEVDPEAWWAALLAAIVAAGGIHDVSAISIAAQQHGLIALDHRGEIVRPALLWNDTRAGAAATALAREVGDAEYRRRTGLSPVASFTASKLRWLRDAEPANARRVAAVALPHDWISWRLRGYGPRDRAPLGPDLEALATDRSDASGTGYWSPVQQDYDLELLGIAFGRIPVLPRVLDPGTAMGRSSVATGIPSGMTVAAGAGDNAAAALGLGLTPGEAAVSLGTSGTVFVSTSTLPLEAPSSVALFADARGGYLPLVATLNAAQPIERIAALLGTELAEFGMLALQARPGAGGLVMRPYFEGERTPDLPDARAVLSGMSLESTTRENLARATFEGVLCGLADGLDLIRSGGVDIDTIQLIGGAARSPAMAEIAGQLVDADVIVPSPGEHVARGAAVQAAWSLTGTRPQWRPSPAQRIAARPHPEVRAQYAASISPL